MKVKIKHLAAALLSVFAVSCASTAVEERPVSSLDPDSVCVINQDELAALKIRALDFLMQEAPSLTRECEVFSSSIEWNPIVGCLLSQERAGGKNCQLSDPAGYQVAFDPDTLEPYQIYGLTK